MCWVSIRHFVPTRPAHAISCSSSRLLMVKALMAACLCLVASGAFAQTCAQLTSKAGTLAKRLQFAQAAQRYEQALALAANDSEKLKARLGMGVSLVKSGKSAAGRAMLEDLLAHMAPKPDELAVALEGIGDSYLSVREYEAAIVAYEGVVETDGANPMYAARGWTKIGQAEYARARYGEARAAYEAAVRVPRVGSFHLKAAWPGIGDCYRAEARYAEAREAYRQVIAAKNVDEATKLRAEAAIGHSCYEEGDYAAAATAYQSVLAKPNTPSVWRIVERVDTICRRQLHKADDLLRTGKVTGAFREYERVPDMPWVEEHHKASALLGMGNCLAAQGKWGEARAQYGRALAMKGALWPDRGRAQMAIARSYETQGDALEARRAYANVVNMKNASRFDVAEARRHLE